MSAGWVETYLEGERAGFASPSPPPPEVLTLGEMAEVLQEWKDMGITPDSVMYAFNQVYWDRGV